MLRRHRLLETLFVQLLKMPWDRVHADAELMEHGMSDELLERVDRLLGFPAIDPHGDPIPDSKGQLRADQSRLVPISRCQPRQILRVGRIRDD